HFTTPCLDARSGVGRNIRDIVLRESGAVLPDNKPIPGDFFVHSTQFESETSRQQGLNFDPSRFYLLSWICRCCAFSVGTLGENIVTFGIDPGGASQDLKISHSVRRFNDSFQRPVPNSEAATRNELKRRSPEIVRVARPDGRSFKGCLGLNW